MKVTLIDHMGSDLSVVNAARVSFAKKHDAFDDSKDAKLIRYLAKHGHWTPFGHTSVTLHLKAPIFLARQLVKHQVGLVWNEVSRRYVDSEPEYFTPDWRSRPDDSIKQGSGGSIDLSCVGTSYPALNLGSAADSAVQGAIAVYNELIEAGVAPEQARMILPQSVYTEWYWTGSIAAFARVVKQRSDPTAQKEAQEIASQISECIQPLFPVSYEALMKN